MHHDVMDVQIMIEKNRMGCTLNQTEEAGKW